MKKQLWQQVLTHAVALILGLGIGYSIWNATPQPSTDSLANKITKPALGEESSIRGDVTATENSPTTTDQDKEEEEKGSKKKPETPVEEIEVPKPKPVGANELARVDMGISDKKISQVLSAISKNLEAKTLAYRSDLMQDCSGIYHQLKDSLQTRLPALKEGAEYQYPSPSNVRSSRQIADWFYKNDNLLIVQDAKASRNSIRPGSVMFYGKSNKKFSNIDIDMLTDRKNNYTSNGAIMHIAVVTEVKTDADGNVLEYTIMHGRRPGRHAKRTGSKEVQSTSTPGLPPFGHWSQQWVAVANIATPK